jgi:hypothetical protein
MRIWNRIAGEPWAITETALYTILEIAARENESPQAVAAKLGRNLQNTYSVTEREGVAIIPVAGPLFRYANLFTMISGASSYELIARDFTAALENPQIKGIILDIDSPGGEVNGVSELSQHGLCRAGQEARCGVCLRVMPRPARTGLPPLLMRSWCRKPRRWDQSVWSVCIKASRVNRRRLLRSSLRKARINALIRPVMMVAAAFKHASTAWPMCLSEQLPATVMCLLKMCRTITAVVM